MPDTPSEMLRFPVQLSNYNPTCRPGSNVSLSCPLGGQFPSDQYSWLASNLASYSRTAHP